jgi:hypothetical protein
MRLLSESFPARLMDKNKTLPLRILLPLLAAYLVISIVGMLHHELWLDEAQHFLIGRDSHSLPGMYYNMRYDGHPRLWNFLIYLVTHYITESYAGMQVLHLLITTCTIFVFLRYAPFSLLIKILIISGYYFLFEYNLLSRNYALGILLLFACCILLREPRKNILWIGVLLFVMCNTHLFFAFAAIGIFLYLLPEFAREKQLFSPRWLLFSVMVLAGLIGVAIQTRTPQVDNFYHVKPAEWLTAKNLSFTVYGLIRGWLPIPQFFGGHFWNTYWLSDRNIGVVFRDLLFVFFVAFPGMILRGATRAMVFYYTSVIILLAFFIVTQLAATRYFGMVYIYFLAACWMKSNESGNAFSLAYLPGKPYMRFFLRTTLYAVLVAQIVIGLFALEQDFRRPFTQAKNTIDFVRNRQLTNQEIVVDGYNSGPMLSAYLGRMVYYLDIDQNGSWLYWKTSYFPNPRRTLGDELSRSAHLQELDKFVLIANRKEDTATLPVGNSLFSFTPLNSFENSILVAENFYVYQVTRSADPTAGNAAKNAANNPTSNATKNAIIAVNK